MERLLVVDGSNLLFQMFYGMPARITGKDGRAIQGTLGFVGALGKLLRMTKPSHAVVLFDGECHNERKDIDPEYKANRPDYSLIPEEETPFSQLPDIFRALEELGIHYSETCDCEADDWIAGYARRYGQETEVVIASQDSDFFQLITDRVWVLRYRGECSVLCDRAYIQEKFGIEPEQYADFKALVGDNADHIRGAEKIGPKTAGELMRQFGSLEQVLSKAAEVKKPSIQASLTQNQERLRRNQRLIRLSGSESLPFPLEALAYTPNGKTTIQILHTIGLR